MKALLVVGVAALAFVELCMGALACGRVPVRVRGIVVDATTGVPVEGASLLTLWRPEIARDPEELALRRRHASREGLSRDDLVVLATVVGGAQTDAAGAFEIIVGVGTSCRYGGLTGIRWFNERGSAFDVARALLVEKEGYATLVHETKAARFEEREEDGVVGTLDVGLVRLAPETGR